MKRFTFLSIVLLLLTVGISGQLYAQSSPVIVAPPNNPDTDGDGLPDSDDNCPNKAGSRENRGCPEKNSSDDDSGTDKPEPVDEPTNDSDGDGLSDPDDRCPTEGGPTWTGGCPEDVPPPTVPDPNDIPDPNDDPFIPPIFPSDGCYVASSGNYSVNVRKATDVTALQLGFLLPSVVYKSEGYITVGADNWFVMNEYENSTGDTGYAFGGVLLSSGCDKSVGSGAESAADDFAIPPKTPLCYMSVGYDSATWGENPEIPSYTFAALWFALEPGQPIPAGTKAWGVIYLADFVTLPDHNNIVAITSDAALFEEASNAPFAGAYNWPTMNGGIQSGDKQLFRLSPPYESGGCGPIVGIDDFATAPDAPDNGIGVVIVFNNDEAPTRNNNTAEYCIYLEVQEAGVFEEVCYEVEVPLGCTLVAQEAGVYKLVCIDDLQNGGTGGDDSINNMSIGDQGETRKEDAGWWETVLDLACPGGWSFITEIDADGDEVVTDVTSCKGENE